jgi:predicted amidophosphoribosyltransferase
MIEGLIPCRVCKHQVAESAIRCPNCGAKLGEEKDMSKPVWKEWRITDNFFIRIILGFLIVYFIFLAINHVG